MNVSEIMCRHVFLFRWFLSHADGHQKKKGKKKNMFLPLVVLCSLYATTLAQTTVIQRYYGTSTCSDAPFFEVMFRTANCPLSPSQQQCSSSLGSPPVYLKANCQSLPVPSFRGGYEAQTFTNSDCSGAFTSYTTARTNTCFAIRTGSVKYSCSPTGGAFQQLFSDNACTVLSGTTTLSPTGVASGVCVPQGSGSGFYTCSASFLLPSVTLLGVLLLIFTLAK